MVFAVTHIVIAMRVKVEHSFCRWSRAEIIAIVYHMQLVANPAFSSLRILYQIDIW